jgi:hypothetical protein
LSCSPLYGLSVRYIHDQRSEGRSEFTLKPIGVILLAHGTKYREAVRDKDLRDAPSDSRGNSSYDYTLFARHITCS